MPKFINTLGNTKIAIAICGRCSRKFAYSELVEDPNFPGLFVCPEDRDDLDPYRLPARETENITLEHPRPDVALTVGNQLVPAPQQEFGITTLNPSVAWTPNTAYVAGNQVTNGNPVGFAAAGDEFWQYVCIQDGTSGSSAPAFPLAPGETVADGTTKWLNMGLYLP